MSFLVTARKWRPQIFEDVVGQEHISTTIKNAILNNRIAHAYLFAGPRGVGKTTTARIFAKILNCTNPQNGEPCNTCEMCNAFNTSQSLDIIEIDGASNRRIEEIRTLRESVKYAPTKGNYKVYIIDEVHMLTTESFNALLKTLEEPPDRTIFIFATTDVHKVPATIISRCQRFDFRRIELETLKRTLNKIAIAENITIDDQSLTIIAKKADGALRDAESLFDQVVSFCGSDIKAAEVSKMLNLIDDEIYFDFTEAILNKDFGKAFDISRTIYDNGWNYVDFLNGLLEHFRNLMVAIIRHDSKLIEASEEYKKKYLKYDQSFSEGDLLRILNFINKLQYEIKSSVNPKLKIEVSLCHIIGLEKTSTISELLNNLGDSASLIKKKVINESSSNYTVSNKESYDDSKVLEPAIKTEPQSNLDFEFISANWKKFIDLINSEKFTLGSHLTNSKPVECDDNTLIVGVASLDDVNILKNNRSYIGCLVDNSSQIFNQKLNFEFICHAINNSDSNGNMGGLISSGFISNVDDNLSKEESSLINAVIKELGGREISR